MSIFNNLYTGSSGLAAHGKAISVVGDNIANVSTTGFKSSRAGFSDVLGGTSGSSRLGAGVIMDGAQTRFSQGMLQQTGGNLDLAVRGNGYFVVGGNLRGNPGSYYTRDGRFNMNNEGFMVNPHGMRLQGYLIDAQGNQSTGMSDLQLGAGQSPPAPTTAADMAVNLDAGAIPPPAWDPTDPSNTSNYSTSMTVYDSLGAAHRSEVFFRSSGAGAWEWHAMVDGGELTGGTPGTLTEIANGTLGFTTNGELDTETVGASSANFINAAPGQVINFDFGDSITTDGGTGLSGSTQFAGPSSVSAIDQDGFGFGTLMDVQIADDGTIEGSFSNGQRRAIARVALAIFNSESGLERAGDAMFRETSASGQPLVDSAATGGRGSISGGMLEGSNVDLGDELVTLIAYQRAFQANVKTVTTADEMLAEIASIKR